MTKMRGEGGIIHDAASVSPGGQLNGMGIAMPSSNLCQ